MVAEAKRWRNHAEPIRFGKGNANQNDSVEEAYRRGYLNGMEDGYQDGSWLGMLIWTVVVFGCGVGVGWWVG